nr:MAG TPA: hypothetical protein [Caudoviricetes sp.]
MLSNCATKVIIIFLMCKSFFNLFLLFISFCYFCLTKI